MRMITLVTATFLALASTSAAAWADEDVAPAPSAGPSTGISLLARVPAEPMTDVDLASARGSASIQINPDFDQTPGIGPVTQVEVSPAATVALCGSTAFCVLRPPPN